MRVAVLRRLAAAGLAGVLTLAGQPGVLAVAPGTVTLRGTLSARIADDFAGGRSATDGYDLVTATGTVPLLGAIPAAALGTEVVATGTLEGDGLQVTAGGVATAPAAPATVTAPAPASIKLAIILVNFTDDTSQPYTPAAAAGVAFSDPDSVSAYFGEESYGAFGGVTGTVYGWYTIAASTSAGCNYNAWTTAAKAKAATGGYAAANFTHTVIAWPKSPSCWWAGLGGLPGNLTWNNGYFDPEVVAHELGHNMGLAHASSLSCKDPASGGFTALSATCTSTEYGDIFDAMGSGYAPNSNYTRPTWMTGYRLRQLGWIGAADIQTVTAGGTYTVGTLETATAHPKIVRILRPGTTEYIYLEFRQPHGTYFDVFDAADPVVNGVSLRLGPASGIAYTYLLDTTPDASEDMRDGAIAVGRMFVDRMDGIGIATTAVSAAGATVEITFGAAVDMTPPAVTAPVVTPSTATPDDTVSAAATLTDPHLVTGAALRLDGRPWVALPAGDGAFGGGSEGVTAVIAQPRGASLGMGDHHACVVTVTGRIRCWGAGDNGQLGDGSTADTATPVWVSGITTAASVSAGQFYTCALLLDHTVRCWGANDADQLGDGATHGACPGTWDCSPTPVTPSGLGTVTVLSAGSGGACAVISGGTVKCWGWIGALSYGAPATAISGITTATSVSVGFDHACAILSGGSVVCWGAGGQGQLGDGLGTDSDTPVAVSSISTATSLAAFGSSTCALLADHTVRCWGAGSAGQLGNGSTADAGTPVTVTGLATATRIAGSGNSGGSGDHACAVLADATVRCWGSGTLGELGTGNETDHTTPVAMPGITGAADVGAGRYVTCVLGADGAVRCAGYGMSGILGDAGLDFAMSPVALAAFPPALADGVHAVCVRGTDGGGNTGGGACAPVTVTGARQTVHIAYTGSTAAPVGASVTLSAHLTDAADAPLTGRSVTLDWGFGTATVITDGAGNASTGATAPASAFVYPVLASFAGDATYAYAAAGATLNVRGLAAPGAPTGVTASPGNSSAHVVWTAPADNGGRPVTGYTVTASPDGLTCTAALVTECTVTGLANGTPYTFTVRAANSVGQGPASDPSNSATPANIVPGVPVSVTATRSASSIVAGWDAPLLTGASAITGYTATASPGGQTCATDSAGRGCVIGPLPDGQYVVTVTATNSDGTSVASAASAAVWVDVTPPWATAPLPGFAVGAVVAATAVPVRLVWTGGDGTGSGVARYDAWQSTSGAAYKKVASPTGTAMARSLKPSSTATYRFRLRAVDGLGLASGWKIGPAFRVRLVQDAAAAVKKTGTWTARSSASALGGGYRTAAKAGARASYTFTGRAVAIVGSRGKTLGSFLVTIDGVPQGMYSEYATSALWRRIVYATSWAASAKHTIVITCLATPGRPTISLDAVVVLG